MRVRMLIALGLTISSVLAIAQTKTEDDPIDFLVSRVKQTPASQLDPALPGMTLEKWLRLRAGRDAEIAWAVRTAVRTGQGFPWVEADVSIQGHPGIVIMIANGTAEGGIAAKPTLHSLPLVQADRYAEWSRLRDLPLALKKARRVVR